PWSPLLTTVASERVPEDVRGRVFGILTAVSVIAVPVGVLVVGLSLEIVGVRPFMMMIAFALAAVAVAVSITPEIRKLNRLPGEMVQDSSKS
ncbi:MAG: MFS transporter, partial [Chloroflexota bacterium]|nr:MFS transporter [Chloroflexota bacterium]